MYVAMAIFGKFRALSPVFDVEDPKWPCMCNYFQYRSPYATKILLESLEICIFLGLYSLSGWTAYRKISRSLKPARFILNFSRCSEIWQAPQQHSCRDTCQILEWYNHYNTQSRSFRNLTRFGGKMSYGLVNRGHDSLCIIESFFKELNFGNLHF